MRKFYFTACSFNIIILLFGSQILFPLIENQLGKLLDSFIDNNKYVDYGYYFYIFIFWWTAPLSIIVIKNHHKHILYFISITTLITLLIFINIIGFDLKIIINDVMLFFIPSAFISILTHYSQMIIGKKLLPTMYKSNSS